jgi:heme-degrading monooxygenase HmoA
MFVRVQTVEQPAEKLDELTKVAQEQLPAAHELPGSRGFFYYLIDRANEKALVKSLWETEEDLRQVEGNATLRDRTEAEAGVRSPPTEVFEVALQASWACRTGEVLEETFRDRVALGRGVEF